MSEPKVILLVEDNAADAELTIRAFSRHGVAAKVVVARDGSEALDYLFARGAHAAAELPELVLLDLKLPRVNGAEVLRRIRADDRTKLLPVVVLTSSKEESDIRNTYDLGANSYIRKPVDFLEFSEAVKQLGLYWLVLNIAPHQAAPAR